MPCASSWYFSLGIVFIYLNFSLVGRVYYLQILLQDNKRDIFVKRGTLELMRLKFTGLASIQGAGNLKWPHNRNEIGY